jgi:HEAT repeat protein
VAEPLRAWLVAGAHPAPVVQALRTLPGGTAIAYVAMLARQTIPAGNREELAEALRSESWVSDAIAQRRSPFWWRRLEAARALSLVAGPRERDAVRALLHDPHPAVQLAAATAVPRVADAAILDDVLDGIDRMPGVVRHALTAELVRSRSAIGSGLADRIQREAPAAALAGWIGLADLIDDPLAVQAALARAEHPDAAVRRTLARALRRRPGPDSEAALARLVRDADATVRAAAARTLGELHATGTVAALTPLLSDPVWAVRLRAAIALGLSGERGRGVLRAARDGTDRFARDMAALVVGLSDGALIELGDG